MEPLTCPRLWIGKPARARYGDGLAGEEVTIPTSSGACQPERAYAAAVLAALLRSDPHVAICYTRRELK